MDDLHVRLECLRLAAACQPACPDPTSAILERAHRFADFVENTGGATADAAGRDPTPPGGV